MATRSFARNLPMTLAIAAAVVLGGATVAHANQGGRVRSTATTDQGSRANITGSATVGPFAGVIATVRVEATTAIALFQVGHIKEGASFASNCGTGVVGAMVERKAPTGPYLCNFVSGTFGSNQTFAAAHNASGWQATRNGSPIGGGPFTLNFSAGRAITVGEYGGPNPPSSFSMTFGPNGGTKWGYKDGQGNWNVITSSATFNGGGWNVGALPSPFVISR